MSELMNEPCQLVVARTMAHMVGSGKYGHVGLGMSLPYRTPAEIERARRIVACVNACAGVPTEALQAWLNPPEGQMGLPHDPWHRHLVALGAERAELLAALEGVLPFLTGGYWPGAVADAAIERAIAIVRKGEGALPAPAAGKDGGGE